MLSAVNKTGNKAKVGKALVSPFQKKMTAFMKPKIPPLPNGEHKKEEKEETKEKTEPPTKPVEPQSKPTEPSTTTITPKETKPEKETKTEKAPVKEVKSVEPVVTAPVIQPPPPPEPTPAPPSTPVQPTPPPSEKEKVVKDVKQVIKARIEQKQKAKEEAQAKLVEPTPPPPPPTPPVSSSEAEVSNVLTKSSPSTKNLIDSTTLSNAIKTVQLPSDDKVEEKKSSPLPVSKPQQPVTTPTVIKEPATEKVEQQVQVEVVKKPEPVETKIDEVSDKPPTVITTPTAPAIVTPVVPPNVTPVVPSTLASAVTAPPREESVNVPAKPDTPPAPAPLPAIESVVSKTVVPSPEPENVPKVSKPDDSSEKNPITDLVSPEPTVVPSTTVSPPSPPPVQPTVSEAAEVDSEDDVPLHLILVKEADKKQTKEPKSETQPETTTQPTVQETNPVGDLFASTSSTQNNEMTATSQSTANPLDLVFGDDGDDLFPPGNDFPSNAQVDPTSDPFNDLFPGLDAAPPPPPTTVATTSQSSTPITSPIVAPRTPAPAVIPPPPTPTTPGDLPVDSLDEILDSVTKQTPPGTAAPPQSPMFNPMFNNPYTNPYTNPNAPWLNWGNSQFPIDLTQPRPPSFPPFPTNPMMPNQPSPIDSMLPTQRNQNPTGMIIKSEPISSQQFTPNPTTTVPVPPPSAPTVTAPPPPPSTSQTTVEVKKPEPTPPTPPQPKRSRKPKSKPKSTPTPTPAPTSTLPHNSTLIDLLTGAQGGSSVKQKLPTAKPPPPTTPSAASSSPVLADLIKKLLQNQQGKPPTQEDIQKQAAAIIRERNLSRNQLTSLAQDPTPPTPPPTLPPSATSKASSLSSLLTGDSPNPFTGGLRFGDLELPQGSSSTSPLTNVAALSNPLFGLNLGMKPDLSSFPGFNHLDMLKKFINKDQLESSMKEEDKPVKRDRKKSSTKEKEKPAKKVKVESKPKVEPTPPPPPPSSVDLDGTKIVHSPNVKEVTTLETPSGILILTPSKKQRKRKKDPDGNLKKSPKRARQTSRSPVRASPSSSSGNSGIKRIPPAAHRGRLPRLKLKRTETKWSISDYVFHTQVPDSALDCTSIIEKAVKRRERRKSGKSGSSSNIMAQVVPSTPITPPPLQRAPPPESSVATKQLPILSPAPASAPTTPGSTSVLSPPPPLTPSTPTPVSAQTTGTCSTTAPPTPQSAVSTTPQSIESNHPPTPSDRASLKMRIKLSKNNNPPLSSSHPVSGQTPPTAGQSIVRHTPRKAKASVKYTTDHWWDDTI